MSKAEQTYRAEELLRRWISGDLNAAEERELERMAAEDPLLAEALQGLRTFPDRDHQRYLQQLDRRLRHKGRRSTSTVWRVAAAAVLLLSLGLALWIIGPGSSPDETLAQERAAQAYEPEPGTADRAEPPLTSLPEAPPSSPQKPRLSPGQEQPANSTNPATQPGPATAKPPATGQTQPLLADRPPQKRPSVKSEPLLETEALAEEAPTEPSYETDSQEDTSSPIALSRRMPPPPANRALPLDEREEAATRQEAADTPAPLTGFADYERFLQRSISQAALPTDSSFTEIELQFTIGPGGQPAQLQFTDSLPADLREKIERLFLSGPRWSPPGQEVNYRFRLPPR